MKRNKHILINLNDDQFQMLEVIAENTNRKKSDVAYLLLIAALNDEIINHIKTSGEIKKAEFKTSKDK